MPLLEVQDLEGGYGDIQVLWGLSFDVEEGDLVTILGPNGAGKTTTIRAIAGQLRPLRGTVRFAGEVVSHRASHEIVARGIAQIPEGRELFPDMTVGENLVIGAYPAGQWRSRQARLESVFAYFPILREREWQVAASLSGGEQQMLAIGRALMAHPRLLLVDELSLGLAPRVAKELFAALARMNAGGLTILLVEQDARKALGIAHRGIVLENGRMALAGRSSELLESPYIRKAYLGA